MPPPAHLPRVPRALARIEPFKNLTEWWQFVVFVVMVASSAGAAMYAAVRHQSLAFILVAWFAFLLVVPLATGIVLRLLPRLAALVPEPPAPPPSIPNDVETRIARGRDERVDHFMNQIHENRRITERRERGGSLREFIRTGHELMIAIMGTPIQNWNHNERRIADLQPKVETWRREMLAFVEKLSPARAARVDVREFQSGGQTIIVPKLGWLPQDKHHLAAYLRAILSRLEEYLPEVEK